MFSPIVFDFGERYSIFVASIVGVHVTLSYNLTRQRAIHLLLKVSRIEEMPEAPRAGVPVRVGLCWCAYTNF